jgi:hypothetical protein
LSYFKYLALEVYQHVTLKGEPYGGTGYLQPLLENIHFVP